MVNMSKALVDSLTKQEVLILEQGLGKSKLLVKGLVRELELLVKLKGESSGIQLERVEESLVERLNLINTLGVVLGSLKQYYVVEVEERPVIRYTKATNDKFVYWIGRKYLPYKEYFYDMVLALVLEDLGINTKLTGYFKATTIERLGRTLVVEILDLVKLKELGTSLGVSIGANT